MLGSDFRLRRRTAISRPNTTAWRRGGARGRALLAVGHSLLTVIYYLLRDGLLYQDLGSNYFDQRDRSQIARQAVRRLERLGYRVALTEGAA